MRIPARIGEGLSALSKGNTPEHGVGLKEVLNEISSNLTAIISATQETDFAAMKTAAALIDILAQSEDVGR